MTKKLDNLSIDYDSTTDVLCVFIGEPRSGTSIQDQEGVLISKDATGKPVAVTVLNYDSQFRALPDVSWLATRGLPSDLVDYLQARPAF